MSHPAQNTSLSLSTRLLYYLGPSSTILLTSIASPRTALLSPLAFLPTAWFLRKWRESNNINPSRLGELEPMMWTYAAAGTIGITAVGLTQMITCKAASIILFTADELTRRAELAASWQNWVFNRIVSTLSFQIFQLEGDWLDLFWGNFLLPLVVINEDTSYIIYHIRQESSTFEYEYRTAKNEA